MFHLILYPFNFLIIMHRFPCARLVASLGAMQGLYVPLEVREMKPEQAQKVESLGVYSTEKGDSLEKLIKAYEGGRYLTRDIQGSDPERMAPPNVAKHVVEHFKNSDCVTVEVVSDTDEIEKSYPCLGAVNRACKDISRHQARVIKLKYEGAGTINDTVLLVGKGVTYDTCGADVKAGGVMAGMHRDKGGASAVAGFFEVLNQLKPPNLKVYGTMSMVRNSIGPEGYVADEIITSRAGVRVRVGNTDAEGRMAMVDCLCEAKELALSDPDPQLMTVATLTGHACLAVGNYSTIIDNGPARAAGTALKMQEAGEKIGDMFEISTVRREDWDFVKDKSGEFVSVLQCNNAPSSRTPRGHQFPAAFMMQVSGLDKHMMSSKEPLKYSHMDIAGSAGNLPDPTTGAPIPALLTWLQK